ncbi:MarR family winged helix-turn-helix transcriptional regulator [Sphingobium baderi]|uniref:MarR family transcriptional regulator n=1 Tax=Sphingobium baderi TaxID=1332080 RepID=A0A0S3F664_9SPHN|nr:MarR family winged helix-turn-helix transcriptional regulator [Sphingobium baderi]ALR23120.1 MarR family transcriptional regulator [Sphingobium baderi]
MSNEKVHSAHISAGLPDLHRSLIEIVSVMNRPERDAELLARAGLSLERALFPLLILVERVGPIGVVDLAGRVGRDYTTVSRQVSRLEELGLVSRQPGVGDKRIRQAVITGKGKEAADSVASAREQWAVAMFEDWEVSDFEELIRLLRMLVKTMCRDNG